MKAKLLLGFLLSCIVSSASAQWHPAIGNYRYHNHHCCYRNGIEWVAPIFIGGVIGYELAQQRQVIVQQVQPQIINDPNLVVINGILYRKTMMEVNGVVQEILIRQ